MIDYLSAREKSNTSPLSWIRCQGRPHDSLGCSSHLVPTQQWAQTAILNVTCLSPSVPPQVHPSLHWWREKGQGGNVGPGEKIPALDPCGDSGLQENSVNLLLPAEGGGAGMSVRGMERNKQALTPRCATGGSPGNYHPTSGPWQAERHQQGEVRNHHHSAEGWSTEAG